MVFRKRRRSTRSFRRRVRRRTGSKRWRRAVARVIDQRAEKKYNDFILAATGIPGSGLVIEWATVAMGTSDNQRIGDQIRMRQLLLRTLLTFGDTYNTVRLVVLAWKFPSSVSVPNTTLILEDAVSNPLISPLNRETMQKGWMKPMYDKAFSMTEGNRPQVYRTLKFFGKRLPWKRVEFVDATTFAAPTYYMFLVSDSIAVPHPTVAVHFRSVFTDT